MHQCLVPDISRNEPFFIEHRDTTAPEGLVFVHASDSKPLSTPWQVSSYRGRQLSTYALPDGYILDCASGSGIQLAALGHHLQRKILGIELDSNRALATAENINRTINYFSQHTPRWLEECKIVVADSTTPNLYQSIMGADNEGIALLYLDPARPRNSRTHSLEEMQPPLGEVLGAWKPYLNTFDEWPALCLDLSPRLVEKQRMDVELLVRNVFPNIPMTWEWSSRGGARTDRLMLWVGCVASKHHSNRFVRYPPTAEDPVIYSGNVGSSTIETSFVSPQRGGCLTVVDPAFVESGLVQQWVDDLSLGGHVWVESEGRRPFFVHKNPLSFSVKNEELLIQCTGRVVDIIRGILDGESVQEMIKLAIMHRFSALTLRCSLPPDVHPVVQGTIQRQLKSRGGVFSGFVVKHPSEEVFYLCKE